MSQIYSHLTTQERAVVMTVNQHFTQFTAERLCRSHSWVSRELRMTQNGITISIWPSAITNSHTRGVDRRDQIPDTISIDIP
jgi:IS30 family transposase